MISESIEKIITASREPRIPRYLKARGDEPVIAVSEITSQAALLYERLRTAVDYKEEHMIRRAALERILKRKVALNISSNDIAKSLIAEFIRAGYLPNNAIPDHACTDIQKIIDKHIRLSKLVATEVQAIGISPYWKHIISMAATEVERFLFSHALEDATLETFHTSIKHRIKLPVDEGMTDAQRDIQIYIACARSVFKYDESTLYYHLFTTFYPQWKTHDEYNIDEIAKRFASLHTTIYAHLKHRLSWQLVPKLKNESIFFSLIKELVEKYDTPSLHTIFDDPTTLRKEITKIANEKYESERSRVSKSSWRAVIYIFFTKIILAVAFEIPFDFFIYEEINYIPLAINVIFHPLLLFAITTSIKNPPSNNTDLIVSGISAHVYDQPLKSISLQRRNYNTLLNSILAVIYLAMFGVTFGAIIWFLERFSFNIISGILFLFFLTLVSYFGLRIRYTAKKWHVIGGKENPLSFIWDLFTLPIVKVGGWLSKKFASINVFIFIMDFIIEAPFKLILELFEEFISFVREKKEEVY